MEDFKFFCLLTEKRNPGDDWRQKTVWHRTKTGLHHKIKVKSLPKQDQYRYAPMDVKLKHLGTKPGYKFETPPSTSPLQEPEKRLFILYYSADRPEGSFDKFTNGKLVMATDDSAKAIEIEKKGHKVAVAHSVPLEAFIKYWDYEKEDWISFPEDIEDEKKFELINWTDNNDVYLVDFFKYKNQIQFHLSDPNEEEKGDKNEGISKIS